MYGMSTLKTTQVIVSEPKCLQSSVVTWIFDLLTPKCKGVVLSSSRTYAWNMKDICWKLIKLSCQNQSIDRQTDGRTNLIPIGHSPSDRALNIRQFSKHSHNPPRFLRQLIILDNLMLLPEFLDITLHPSFCNNFTLNPGFCVNFTLQQELPILQQQVSQFICTIFLGSPENSCSQSVKISVKLDKACL